MSKKNVKYWSHEELVWKNTGSNLVIEEKDYPDLVWTSEYAKKGRPEDTRALQRIGRWLKGTLKKQADRRWKLSVVAQEFTQRGWTVDEVIEDLNQLAKLVKKKNATAGQEIKELLHKSNRSFEPSKSNNAQPLDDDKMLDFLDDWS